MPKHHIEGELKGPSYGIEGVFIVQERRGDAWVEIWRSKNMIVDDGLDLLMFWGFNIEQATHWLGVGKGGSPAAATTTDTNLPSEPPDNGIYFRSQSNWGQAPKAVYSAADGYWAFERYFDPAEHIGTWTEVGLFPYKLMPFSMDPADWFFPADPMFCRQLVSLTHAAFTDWRVIYQMRVYYPTADQVDTVVIDGVTYTVTTRPYRTESYSNWGAWALNFPGGGQAASYFVPDSMYLASTLLITSPIQRQHAFETDVLVARSGASLTNNGISSNARSDSASRASPVSGLYYWDWTNVWNPDKANFATGIGIVTTEQEGRVLWQTKFSPKLPKTDLKRMTLTFRHTVARYP